MAVSDMRNRRHVQPLLTWSTNAAHPVSLDQEPLQEWVTINKQAYKEILVRLRDAIRRKRNQLFKSKLWKLLHDNAPAHRAIIAQNCLSKHSVSVLPHPPYSPDIVPCDFFFFPKLKMTLKGRRFSSSSEVIENTTVELNKLRKIDKAQFGL
ncbi:hypothetical protein LAZ67_16000140 [Cordylochernes scorpioides]|uniref:Transposase n=1 Tax=Cordylochernes scorpioides TaxID=51811 RepID=A0ABY6LD14_9ARAC|nr:hypothetical protein LAZ67_16000140 [Cordylochernes scorpioides]